MATTLKVVLLLAIPSAAMHRGVQLWNVIGSYFFVPTANADGLIVPVVVQGWTLNFEMFFYLIFTCSLLVTRFSPLVLVISVLITIGLIGIFHPISAPAAMSLVSPMLFEFLFGVFIARLLMKKRIPGAWGSGMLAAIGWVSILTIFPHLPQGSDEVQKWRFVLWGVPAAAIVLGTVGLEPILAARLPKWIVVAGNASYAVYLAQTFVLPAVGIAVNRMAIGVIPALVLIILMGMSLSFFGGDVIHRRIELPILTKLKRLNVAGVSTVPKVGVER
jgi:exopolysaccharide production protein ExoZ